MGLPRLLTPRFVVADARPCSQHLIYSVADEVFAVVFPEIKEPKARPLFLS